MKSRQLKSFFTIVFVVLFSSGCESSENATFQNSNIAELQNEHQRIVNENGQMKPENFKLYQKTTNKNEKVTLLIKDFFDDEHYHFAPVYNSPAFTTDYVEAIQAGKLLVELTKSDRDVRDFIINELKKPFETEEGVRLDIERGAALHFLEKILSDQEKNALKDELSKTFGQSSTKDEIPTYTEFYLRRL